MSELPPYFYNIEHLKENVYEVYACKDTGRRSKVAEFSTYLQAKEYCNSHGADWKILAV